MWTRGIDGGQLQSESSERRMETSITPLPDGISISVDPLWVFFCADSLYMPSGASV